MKKYVIYAALVAVFGTLSFFLDTTTALFVIVSGVAVGALFVLIAAIVEHSDNLRIAYYCARYWNQHIRLSISYLFRITVDGEYLLVKSSRYADQFQPIGGVYKRNPSASDVFRRLGVLDDDFLPVDNTSKSDLRVRVRGRHLVAFVLWFESAHNREIGGWREFYEEAIASGVLPREPFESIAYDFVRREYRPLRYSAYARSKELLVADVFELVPTDSQLEALRALRAAGDERVRFVTEEQIARLGGAQGAGVQLNIGEHTQWTVG